MSRTRADLLASYRSYLALQRDLSGHTVRAYLVDVSDLLSFLGVGEKDSEPVDPALATLDLADLRDWLAAMAASGHSRATLARRSASVRTFSSWAFEAGLLASDVAAALPDSAPGLLVGGDLDAVVERIAVSGGAGDSLLQRARDAGADVFLTADLRHHPASEHLEDGRPYLLCGTHWATEWVGLEPLARRLKDGAHGHGASLAVQVSRIVTDPWALRLPTGPDRA